MQVREMIRAKRDGESLDAAALRRLADGISDGSVGDEQLGAFAMAVFLNGMDDEECAELTEAMRDSGRVMRWDDPTLPGPVVDKHSTGGVGDVTSLLIAPIVAACGGFVPMIAGPGLGHTGGTVDKLAAIPGYDVTPAHQRFQSTVREIGCAIIGQTEELAPADRRFYAVRDVTATVESIPLIVASILSKKLAEGLDGLVLDIKTGNGAVMTDPEQAAHLARRLVEVGTRAGVTTHALLSDMSQPLANAAGNALEIAEVIEYLTGQRSEGSLLDLSLHLAAEMLLVGKLADNLDVATAMVDKALHSGRAADRFAQMICALGGPADLLESPWKHLPRAPVRREVYPEHAGQVQAIDVRRIGMAVVDLGGGRRKAGDDIDPSVGLTGLLQLGQATDSNHPLAVVHAGGEDTAEQAAASILEAYTMGEQASHVPPLVSGIMRPGGD